ncbi:MAG: phenylalanine--tRNA ligase subunit beta, partial [Cytophagales bacterium]|nr:phenylalanine--tRNA ligase subunit beta [Cytophagales bacterium]
IRVYGFDQIEAPAHIGSEFLADFPAIDANRLKNTIGKLLASNGFNEIVTNSITKESYRPLVGDFDINEQVLILNKLSEDLGAMRQTLLFSGLEVLSHNLNRKQKDLKLFEFGRVYGQKEGKYKEKEQLSLFLTGSQQKETWQQATKPVTFFDAAQIVAVIFRKFRIDAKLVQNEGKYLFEVGGKALATIYPLAKNQLKAFDIRQDVFYVNLDVERLIKLYSDRVEYTEIPKFPEVRRDLSLVLDKSIKFEDLERIARQAERKLLKDINVFDVYEGDKIDQGKKAYALSFVLQDQGQTLTEDQIEKTMGRLISSFEKEFSAVIRK